MLSLGDGCLMFELLQFFFFSFSFFLSYFLECLVVVSDGMIDTLIYICI